MQFNILLLSAFLGLAAAQGSVCFDNFDCILAGGECVRGEGDVITGHCSGSKTLTKTASAPAATSTGSGAVCYDDFDCFGKGGKCVKTGLLGKCG